MSAIRRSYAWLILCLIAQAALMTHRLDLLPMWDDEMFTVRAAQQSVGAMIEMVRDDIHPPLYFLLAHYWIKIAPGDVLIELRLLSVVFALLATIALDRLFLKHAPPRVRLWCLALWTFSACLLLYSRMARSYSLQVLGFVVVCWAAWRWNQEFASWKRLLICSGSLVALLYTHYVPGIAAWAGVNVLLWPRVSNGARQRAGRWLIGNAIVLAAYLPWLATLPSVLRIWQTKPSPHLFTASILLETGIKLAYGSFSFLFGEAVPVWMLPITVLVAAPSLWLLWTGARAGRRYVIPVIITAAIGFAGVAGWVSYAFVPARLLFLLPLVLFAIAAGAQYAPRAGTRDRGSAPGREPGGHRIVLPGARSAQHRLSGADGPHRAGYHCQLFPGGHDRAGRRTQSERCRAGVLPAGFHHAAYFYCAGCRSSAAGTRQSRDPACMVLAQSSRRDARSCAGAPGNRRCGNPIQDNCIPMSLFRRRTKR